MRCRVRAARSHDSAPRTILSQSQHAYDPQRLTINTYAYVVPRQGRESDSKRHSCGSGRGQPSPNRSRAPLLGVSSTL